MTHITLILQFTIGVVFLLSALGKLWDPLAFARGVEEYEIVPESMTVTAGIMIIIIEAWLAVSHLTGYWLRLAAPIGMALLSVFTVAGVLNLRRGRVLPCHCFGVGSSEAVSGRTLLRLALLLTVESCFLVKPAWTRDWYALRNGLRGAEVRLAVCWVALLIIALSWLMSLPELIELQRTTKGHKNETITT
jgi:hypothetical protein